MDQALSAFAVFGFIAFGLWLQDRRQERRDARRHELYEKALATSSGADAIVEMLRRDEERLARQEIDQKWVGGVTTTAVGVALTAFLYYIVPNRPVYLIGTVPSIVGLVTLTHALVLTRRRRTTGTV